MCAGRFTGRFETYAGGVRRLEGPELVAYDVISNDVARRVRIVDVPVLPNGADGMTLGRFIFVRSDRDRRGDRELLAHELVHVRQFAEQGWVRFLSAYGRDYLRGRRAGSGHHEAYLAIDAEVEARADAAAWRERRPSGPR